MTNTLPDRTVSECTFMLVDIALLWEELRYCQDWLYGEHKPSLVAYVRDRLDLICEVIMRRSANA